MLKLLKSGGWLLGGVLLIAAFADFRKQPALKAFHVNGFAQGTTYHIAYYAPDSSLTRFEADSIFHSLDSSLSVYKPYSLITRFNREKRGLVPDGHLKKVVLKAQEVSKASAGIFDITVMPLVKLWGFGPDGRSKTMPGPQQVKEVLQYVGYRKLYFRGDSLLKKDPRLTIDVNGIAQGYTVDVIADFLERRGVEHYLVEVGGEIRVKGRKQPSGEVMKIGIESPPGKDEDPENPVLIRTVFVKGGAVTTSGKYRNFYQNGNKKVSHLMDPRTGYTLHNEMISVTVFAADAITADAYDNVFMGMHLGEAFSFLKKHPELKCYFIYTKKDGTVADTASAGFDAMRVRQ
ncbi:FAD:protein FMN transferase [Niabella drilacis]|uniref:FAD:protein FMN transferase n=1 Tax=Niabella drilacis (strain DSM 25811 / CCM 8410 / CCUG 62505 / LMG 26954 / E90) TaxID=1285928 RepID=A0A1G6ULX9_NIADE|nr:FAD:protein FMN transferase [Niabella drilacis]SDD42352.1 thiamine biosynthesis lipoprotein [Niabella drilacis]